MDLFMPIFCRLGWSKRVSTIRALVVLASFCVTAVGLGQTLARPGWVGSGMTANVWWRHAFVYAIDLHDAQAGGLKGVAARMDGLRALGVDAVLLEGMSGGDGAEIDAAAGTMDDFDAVLVQGSRDNLRVLVELSPKTASEDVSGIARFWLSRGVGGFRLRGGSAEQMGALREAAKGYVGERVMIGDVAASGAATSTGKGDVAQLLLDASIAVAPLDIATIRTALEKNDALNKSGGTVPMLATTDAGAAATDLGPAVATLLLSTRGGAMIRAGQEGAAGTPLGQLLAEWYREMSGLMHSNPTVRTGANSMLNHDADGVVAWVRRPAAVSYKTPAVVFLCNMTDKPVKLSLAEDMKGLGLKGSFLKTVLRTDVGMGAMHLDGMTLGAYAVYIGELKY
jgi:hypothetical protein